VWSAEEERRMPATQMDGTCRFHLRVVGGRQKENDDDANGMEHVASIFVWSLKTKGE